MKKHVPEDVYQCSLDQQMQILRNRLAGNCKGAFVTCRGKLNQQIAGLISYMIETGESPVSLLDHWDDFSSNVRVMVSVLTEFKKDGLNLAYTELLRALQFPGYILPNETVPVEDTEPVTVLMLDPEKTMTLIKWLVEGHWKSLANFVAWNNGSMTAGVQPDKITIDLFKTLPTLEERYHLSNKHSGFEGEILCWAHADAVWHSYPEDIRDRLSKANIRQLKSSQYTERIKLNSDHKFVFILRFEKAQVLRCFSHRDQERIATWEIHLPKIVGATRTFVGIHPEVMHPQLQKMYPTLTSVDVSHGLGCFMGPMVMQDIASEKPEAHGFNIIYHSPRNSHGKFSSTRPYGVLFNDPSSQP